MTTRFRSPKLHPMFQLVLARLREFVRSPEAVFWVYFFPLIMVVALGTAFRNRPVERMGVGIQQGARSEALRDALAADERFQLQVLPRAEAREQLRTGRLDLVIAARATAGPGETGDRVASGTGREPAPLEYAYYYDPTKPTGVLARAAADDVLQRAAGRGDVVAVEDRQVSEPGGRYIDFLIPGLLGMGLMGGGLWGVGFAIVDLRIRKLLKRYLATPMKRSHFLASLMISRLMFTIPEILVLLVFARFFFGVVNHGSYGLVVLLIFLGAFEFAGIGLLVASRAQTLEAVSGLMNLVMLPMWICSGIFFSTDRFPESVQPVLRLLPLTPLNEALRSVMLEGARLDALGPQLALICGWGVVTFALALRWFRWT